MVKIKQVIILLFNIFILINVSAQAIPGGGACKLFRNAKFHNGVDTVITKITLEDIAELAPRNPMLKILDAEKKYKAADFTYQVGFHIQNCSNTFYAPSRVNKKDILISSDIGKTIYLTCVVFERKEWVHNEVPFFLIVDAKRRNVN